MSVFTHRGPWDSHSRQSPILLFLETYLHTVDSLDVTTYPWSKFYSSSAIFHDTRGDVYISGSHIWTWLSRILSPFEKLLHEVIELRVIPEEDGRNIIYGEFLTHFWLKGDKREVVAPRFFVFIVGETEGGEGEGMDGLQIYEASVFWDTGILTRYIEEKKKKGEEERIQVNKVVSVSKGGMRSNTVSSVGSSNHGRFI
ncbi:hypothetical protein BDZ45DRAFT_675508 [Acephala macrosclerotiorum]|nr:hypothetical protein BDZ45DRAFT_675508 [Acephala macrosclerotiorum]